jgi:hypothetical protein
MPNRTSSFYFSFSAQRHLNVITAAMERARRSKRNALAGKM